MPIEIAPPRISSKDMAPSQPVAGVKVEAACGEEAEANGKEQHIKHHQSPSAGLCPEQEFIHCKVPGAALASGLGHASGRAFVLNRRETSRHPHIISRRF